AAEKAVSEELKDVVFAGDQRPMLLRFRISIDGRPFRTVNHAHWDEYVRRLFMHLHRNGDGFFSENGAKNNPPPPLHRPQAAAGSSINVALNYKALEEEGEGRVAASEFAAYYQNFGGQAFQFFPPPPRQPSTASLNRSLFSRLDTNRDGVLSKAEL